MLRERTKTDKSAGDNPLGYVRTNAEDSLLKVLVDPSCRMETVTKKCELAGISRQTYYEFFRKPEFVDYYRALCFELIKSHAATLIHIGLQEALKGGSQGYGYWKELLKMGGIIEDEKLNVGHTGELLVRFVDSDDDDDEDNN